MGCEPGGEGGERGASTAESRRRVTIANERGLHARAAAKFVELAGSFAADVTVTRQDVVVSGRSIMGLMMLAAGPGVEIEIAATGPEAANAVTALAQLVDHKFGEAEET